MIEGELKVFCDHNMKAQFRFSNPNLIIGWSVPVGYSWQIFVWADDGECVVGPIDDAETSSLMMGRLPVSDLKELCRIMKAELVENE